MSAATLLRALFKRPSVAHPAADAGSPTTTHYRLTRIDGAQVARYREALGFTGTRVPLTYCYLLAQRAHLATMLGAALPFRLAGVIHLDNLLSAEAQPDPARPLDLVTGVHVGAAAANGAVQAVLDTHAAQDGTPVFRCRSSYLMVRGRRGSGPRPATPTSRDAFTLVALAAWEPGLSSGRAYASLSGDWNPIHLWSWSARLMGLAAPVIHGMHTQGRVCAELERAGGRPATRLDGRFRAPIPLGSTAALAADLAEGRYIVEAGRRVAVEGGFGFA
jgi:hypothetical protein